MRLRVLGMALVVLTGWFGPGSAQEVRQTWVQIEALPGLDEATDRARAYAALFPDVAGYRNNSGWFAIMLGPDSRDSAAERLSALRREGLIPSDSFLTDGGGQGQQFWPPEGAAPASALTAPDAAPDAAPETEAEAAPETAAAPPPAAEETLAEAKAGEAALSAEERMELQRALEWYGHYDAAIDGSFGAGTRKSMLAWQEANGFDGTGVLTTQQRATLLANFQADKAEFGFETITEAEAGIEITLPMGLIGFDRYEPPFVHYAEKGASGVQVMLISEPGDTFNLLGLFDILQTLEVVPPEGARALGDDSFTIDARSEAVASHAYAEVKNGMVKGYLVVWKPADDARMARILPVLEKSFRGFGDKALDPGLVPLDEAARAGLLAGMEVKVPKLSRSGFFVDAGGTVVTTVEAVGDCARITIDHDTEAKVLASDAATGLAVLAPEAALSPPAFARMRADAARPGTGITVAGYSWGERLPAPVLSHGRLEENAGLNGEAGLARLTAPVMAGDAGGPVLDASGAVLGMLLPAAPGGKDLPEGVAFAAQSEVIGTALTAAGIAVTKAEGNTALSPDALNRAGLGMTVLVSCWP